MNVQRALKDPRLMKALTGLSPQEFDPLVEAFEAAQLESKTKKTKATQGRRRPQRGGRARAVVNFFILF